VSGKRLKQPVDEVASPLGEKAEWIACTRIGRHTFFAAVVRQIPPLLGNNSKTRRKLALPCESGSEANSRTDVIAALLLAATRTGCVAAKRAAIEA